MNLGKNIIKYRKIHNMKSLELAERAGITQSYLSEIERNKKIPSLEVIQKLAKALNTTTSELLGEVPNQVDDNLLGLLYKSRSLSDEQVNAIIEIIKAFKKD